MWSELMFSTKFLMKVLSLIDTYIVNTVYESKERAWKLQIISASSFSSFNIKCEIESSYVQWVPCAFSYYL